MKTNNENSQKVQSKIGNMLLTVLAHIIIAASRAIKHTYVYFIPFWMIVYIVAFTFIMKIDNIVSVIALSLFALLFISGLKYILNNMIRNAINNLDETIAIFQKGLSEK